MDTFLWKGSSLFYGIEVLLEDLLSNICETFAGLQILCRSRRPNCTCFPSLALQLRQVAYTHIYLRTNTHASDCGHVPIFLADDKEKICRRCCCFSCALRLFLLNKKNQKTKHTHARTHARIKQGKCLSFLPTHFCCNVYLTFPPSLLLTSKSQPVFFHLIMAKSLFVR